MVGELDGGRVRYRAMTSCMMLLGQAEGRHIVTVEGLNPARGLTPVQRALAEEGATQCGFCTPGVVVSMTSAVCDSGTLQADDLLEAAGGNICRCTGYASFRRAAQRLERELGGLDRAQDARLASLCGAGVVPQSFERAAGELAQLAAERDEAGQPSLEFATHAVAGGTDVLVQRRFASDVGHPHLFPERSAGEAIVVEGDRLRVDAGATFEALKRSADFRRVDPRAVRDMDLVASQLIRERATVGGNIANASPIADGVILFLALDSELELCGPSGARRLPLVEFYHGYKQTELRPDERIVALRVPLTEPLSNFEKVSKRERLDIASVNSAASFKIDGNRFVSARLSAGGVAPIPLFLERSSASLVGAPLEAETVRRACRTAMEEVTPITDVRGSADYKRLLLGRLVLAHFIESFPGQGFEELAP
jgi:xanthine dehydrogenase small subunit